MSGKTGKYKKIITAILTSFILLISVTAVTGFIFFTKNYDIVIETDNKQEAHVKEKAKEKNSVPGNAGNTPQSTSSLTTEKVFTVVIDAGHQKVGDPGQEPVAPGASQTKAKVASGTKGIVTQKPECEVTLEIAQILNAELKSRGYNVIMVRESNDVNISNSERAAVANNANADAFLRLHCNGSNDSNVNGALSMCQTKNNPYCGSLYTYSRKLSECVLSCLCAETGAKNRGVSETDSMSGINWCKVPVTIIEMGFMTNPAEDRLLSDVDYQKKLAAGIANGLDLYFKN